MRGLGAAGLPGESFLKLQAILGKRLPEAPAAIPLGGKPLTSRWGAERVAEAHGEGIPGTQLEEAGGAGCTRA